MWQQTTGRDVAVGIHSGVLGGAGRGTDVDLSVTTTDFHVVVATFCGKRLASTLILDIAALTVFVVAIISVGAAIDVTGRKRLLLVDAPAATLLIEFDLLGITRRGTGLPKARLIAFFAIVAHVLDSLVIGVGTQWSLGSLLFETLG